MNYTEAMTKNASGARVRLPTWPEGMYIDAGGIESLTGYAHLPTRDEIDSEDWEIYRGKDFNPPSPDDIYAAPPNFDVSD